MLSVQWLSCTIRHDSCHWRSTNAWAQLLPTNFIYQNKYTDLVHRPPLPRGDAFSLMENVQSARPCALFSVGGLYMDSALCWYLSIALLSYWFFSLSPDPTSRLVTLFYFYVFFFCFYLFLILLFCIGIWPVNSVLIVSGDSRGTQPCACVYTPPCFPPIQAATAAHLSWKHLTVSLRGPQCFLACGQHVA